MHSIEKLHLTKMQHNQAMLVMLKTNKKGGNTYNDLPACPSRLHTERVQKFGEENTYFIVILKMN